MIKVSDFGLARNVEEKNYFKTDDQSKELPVRWMSIEAIETGILTTQSDVVSTNFAKHFFFKLVEFTVYYF